MLLTRKLLFLLCSSSSATALPLPSVALNNRENYSLSDSSCLILWSLARDKFMRSTCLRMLEITDFLMGDASSPEASVESIFD